MEEIYFFWLFFALLIHVLGCNISKQVTNKSKIVEYNNEEISTKKWEENRNGILVYGHYKIFTYFAFSPVIHKT